MSTIDRTALLRAFLERLRAEDLSPGSKLPGERELAASFGVSRSSIREVLSVLEVLRVVERRPQSGVYLASSETEASVEALVLQDTLALAPSDLDYEQAQEARLLHEVEAVRLAASRRTDEDLQSLRRIIDLSRDHHAAGRNLADDDEAFHLALVAAAKNAILLRMTRALYLMSRRVRRMYFDLPGHAEVSIGQHEAILATLVSGDVPSAVQAIETHYSESTVRWRSVVRS